MAHHFGSLVFTAAVKALQESHGSRRQYERWEADGSPTDCLGPEDSEFIEARDSLYLATIGSTGWPYIQHRGGPKGFLKVLDNQTIAFADFRGNRQYIAPPLAGITQVPFYRFILYDGMGTLIWAIPPLLVGAYLQKSSEALASRVHPMMPYLPWICVAMIFAVLVWRFFNRRNYLRVLRQTMREGIDPEELNRMIGRADDIVVVDIRDEMTARANPITIANARWIPLPSLASRMNELPTDKPVIVYCDCPQAQGSAAAAKELQKNGVSLARPLSKGLRGWIEKGFETANLEFVS